MFSSTRSEASPSSSLTLAHAIGEIRNSSRVPFNVDELLNTHGISLSSSAQEQWVAPRKQNNNVKELLEQLKEAAISNGSPQVYEQARVWVDDYLESVQSLTTWSKEASNEIHKVEIVRDTLNDMIARIEERIPRD